MRSHNTLYRHLSQVIWITIISLSLISCGDDESGSGGSSGTKFDQLYSSLFNRCGTCHNASGRNPGTDGGPNLSTQDLVYSNLVGKKGSDFPGWSRFQSIRSACNNISFINAGNPSQSLVVAILDPSVASGLGACKIDPHTDTPQFIPTSSLALLKEWISEGASR